MCFTPLDCRDACEKDSDCVLATYDYPTKECRHHGKDAFAVSYKTEKPDAKADQVVFLGSDNSVLRGFSTALADSLQKNSQKSFMKDAYDEAYKVDQFTYLSEYIYTGTLKLLLNFWLRPTKVKSQAAFSPLTRLPNLF